MELFMELIRKPFWGIVSLILLILLMLEVDAQVGELLPPAM